jgi:gluconate 2-dehydrogenase gamma chain
MARITRREVLAGTAALALANRFAGAEVIRGRLPVPSPEPLPSPVAGSGWRFFTAAEGATLEAVVDRLIPPDPATPGGKDAGCAIFIDRQMAGGYGHRQGLYNLGPFQKGTEQQGPQSEKDPAQQYRVALAALDQQARSLQNANGRATYFAGLAAEQQDSILKGIEDGSVSLEGLDSKEFFKHLLTDVQQGFFADPLYGGNKDMCAWKMIGFPGARYDYRDWVSRHNEPYPHPPVSIQGRADWTPRG